MRTLLLSLLVALVLCGGGALTAGPATTPAAGAVSKAMATSRSSSAQQSDVPATADSGSADTSRALDSG